VCYLQRMEIFLCFFIMHETILAIALVTFECDQNIIDSNKIFVRIDVVRTGICIIIFIAFFISSIPPYSSAPFSISHLHMDPHIIVDIPTTSNNLYTNNNKDKIDVLPTGNNNITTIPNSNNDNNNIRKVDMLEISQMKKTNIVQDTSTLGNVIVENDRSNVTCVLSNSCDLEQYQYHAAAQKRKLNHFSHSVTNGHVPSVLRPHLHAHVSLHSSSQVSNSSSHSSPTIQSFGNPSRSSQAIRSFGDISH